MPGQEPPTDDVPQTGLLGRIEEKLLHPEPDLSHLSPAEQYGMIMARVADSPDAVVPREDLRARLERSRETGVPLRIKFGIDPTGPEVHLGHAVPLLNLRLFQRLGHKIQLLIGDFTALIGDPSGRLDARAALTGEDVERNMATYEEQAARIIDLRAPSIERHYNSSWMNRLDMKAWVEMTKKISMGPLLQREDFRNRLASGQGFSLAELEYAIFMGYDSVALEPDIELGGLDQYLNLHMCRQMMSNAGQKPEIVIAYNLLAGTTGERDEAGRMVKMSKSRGNYIPVTAPPAELYGKVMSIPDEVMWTWYRALTEVAPADLAALQEAVERGSVHPKDVKKLLARVLVGTFNHFDPAAVAAAEADFESKFGKAKVLVPDSTEEVAAEGGENLLATLARASGQSRNEVRRAAAGGGVRVLSGDEYVPLADEDLLRPASAFLGAVVRVGKRSFFRIAGDAVA